MRFAAFVPLTIAVLLEACGARSGLDVFEIESQDAALGPSSRLDGATTAGDRGAEDAAAPRDATVELADAPAECGVPANCDPSDPNHVYRCGAAIAACSPLEQCEEREDGAQCVNPCVDSLGNDTSNGCEFYAVEMDTVPEAEGVCYAVFVVNEWRTGEPARLEVSRGGNVLPIEPFARIPMGKGASIAYAAYDSTQGLLPNQVVILFLSRDPAGASDPTAVDPRALANCPLGVEPAVAGDAALHGTGIGTAFRIRSNVPVVAYQMLPYGGGRARVTGSTLLLPTSAWDTNYLVADAYQAPLPSMTNNEPRAGPTTVIVASQDATTVTVKATADIRAGPGVAAALRGTTSSYTLAAGQYLQFTQMAELTGTAVQADKPVGVLGGSTLMDVPLTTLRGDAAQQMLPPVRALGSEYVATRYRTRDPSGAEESVPWRFVGAVDGTRLSYEPAAPAGAPATLDAQELFEFDSPGPFVVRSQDADHPFFVAAYMTGGEPYSGRGDPEFVGVVPPAQYLPRYTFFTDPTYPETNLVVVRVFDPQSRSFPDVTLDCAGLVGGWQPVGTAGAYEFARVDLSTGNFQGAGGCDNGVHVISAALPGRDGGSAATAARFGVTVWGWGNEVTWPPDTTVADEENARFTRWVSYGYPAGANFAPISRAVLLAQ